MIIFVKLVFGKHFDLLKSLHLRSCGHEIRLSVGMAENAHTTDSEEIAFATGEFTQSEDERMVLDDCDYTTNAEQTE